MTRVLQPPTLAAAAKVDGVTFCVVPQEVIAAAARAGAPWSIRPAAVSEAAVNSTCAVIRWVRMSLILAYKVDAARPTVRILSDAIVGRFTTSASRQSIIDGC